MKYYRNSDGRLLKEEPQSKWYIVSVFRNDTWNRIGSYNHSLSNWPDYIELEDDEVFLDIL